MSIFDLKELVIGEYSKYVQSFLSIADERIRTFIEGSLMKNQSLWPEALIQLNPSYEMGKTIKDFISEGKLHPECLNIFLGEDKKPIRLYRHQEEAIEKGLKNKNYVVTSGTGSGKTLTYFVPIFDAILRKNPEEAKTRAIIIYPMNALVNSQEEGLRKLTNQYRDLTGRDCPIRFAKYTGQEGEQEKHNIQKNPPHILLTNYVMLELMLIRPEEHNFVDKTTANLQFLVIDELHTYRGRQGADVGLLIRRLRERCGNPNLQCIGTSATIISGKFSSKKERQLAVSQFATKIFGGSFDPEDVIEEYLQRVTKEEIIPSAEVLKKALIEPIPKTADEMIQNPITTWIEFTFGIGKDLEGNLFRKPPISLSEGANALSELTGIEIQHCKKRLEEFLLLGAKLRTDSRNPIFAFKLHQFVSQGRTVYATLESRSKRFLTLEGQYFAPDREKESILYPLLFCRQCGQDYYVVARDEENERFLPFDIQGESLSDITLGKGYFMLSAEEVDSDWREEYLPPEWNDQNGRIKRDYRQHIPLPHWVFPDGRFKTEEDLSGIKGWYQPAPFMLCLRCGEFYDRRGKDDFRKLSGLSSEGRSTSTTVLSISALENAKIAGIKEETRKILSFTDNRQNASLQAGHFNDFIQVSILRAAILSALEKHDHLKFDNVAQRVVESMGLSLSQIARHKELREDTPQSKEVWNTFRDLIEYRIFEDLRRGWRVVQPNLEQCGLLRIEYMGLEELCNDDRNWQTLPSFRILSHEKRREILIPFLDHLRKKLAISINCLKEQYQQQLRKRVSEQINERWAFDENEKLIPSSRFLLPNQSNRAIEGYSLGESSLIGRYFRRTISISESYSSFIESLTDILCSYGLIKKDNEKGVSFIQLNGAVFIWKKSEMELSPIDPIYARRVERSEAYLEAERRANEYFRNFYRRGASFLQNIEGREHTAQISYEDREEREKLFREGKLSCLFCSPTMELGIDIADLQLLHLRNVPPTPSNYAQRSGRAGRSGDPALILTYCAAGSGHDQYFFRHRQEMISGVVRSPKIDLGNEDLIKAHIHALWLSKVRLSLGDSITDILEVNLESYPLKENIRSQIRLSEERLKECYEEARRILNTCLEDLSFSEWFSEDWLINVLKLAPEEFDKAFDRWRELYRSADRQWQEANEILRHPLRDKIQRLRAESQRREAERQKNLLCNVGTTREESDFYPYRYLASEGFLPGYNFPRLPIRAYIPRKEGEFISRPRFLAIAEFGPRNIIYHEGSKYEVGKLFIPPGGLLSRRIQGKICKVCGYFQKDENVDICENCRIRLDATTSEVLSLLELSNVKTWPRERITSDEEERRRSGYEITTQFRFAPSPGGEKRIFEAIVQDEKNSPLFRMIFAPAAEIYRINHGWRNRKEKGFLIDIEEGDWLKGYDINEEDSVPDSSKHPEIVRLYVRDSHNLLLFYPLQQALSESEDLQATFQYSIQRGIEQVFQIEETELASERIGSGLSRAILFWEASEGGVGVLRRLIEERDSLSKIAIASLERCHFDSETLKDLKKDCFRACYECLLSYGNQRDYPRLNRNIVKDLLYRLSKATVLPGKSGRNYEDHYRWLRSLTDTRSELERKFIDHLYQTKRRLPDEGQKFLKDYYSNPDFFYEPNICIFCDGSVHDEPKQREKDRITRQELKDRGYRVIVIRYDKDIEEQVRLYPDVFG